MKTLILSMLMLPMFAQAKKFEISEQVGQSKTYGMYGFTKQSHELSNQVTVTYKPLKHLSIGGLYEYTKWNNADNHSFGIAADFTSRYFFAGADLKVAMFSRSGADYTGIDYNTSFGYGVHAGSHQKISKHMSFIEQVGYGRLDLKGKSYWPINSEYHTAEFPHKPYSYTYKVQVDVLYIRVGLAYRF